MMNWGTFGWGMGFGWLWMVLFWGLIIWIISIALNSNTKHPASEGRQELPLELLKKRYAGGELTKQEFDRLRHDLKQ